MTIDDINRKRINEKKKLLPAATACNYSLLLSCLRLLTKKIKNTETQYAAGLCVRIECWLVVKKDNGKYMDDVCNEVEAPAALATKWHQKCSNASSHKNNLIPFFSSSLSLSLPLSVVPIANEVVALKWPSVLLLAFALALVNSHYIE